MRRLLAVTIAIGACSDHARTHAPPPAPAPPPVETPAPAPAAPPVAPIAPVSDAAEAPAAGSAVAGGTCTTARDCKSVPEESDCIYSCTGGICQLRGTTHTPGAGPCYGEILAQAATTLSVDPPPPVFLLCDAYAGLYCNRTTHVCEEPKRTGAACAENAECGLDGACSHGVCARAPSIGGACVPGQTSCGRDGYCDGRDQRCSQRHENGEACENLGEQCKSGFCGFASPTKQKMVCMPRPFERHCPEVP